MSTRQFLLRIVRVSRDELKKSVALAIAGSFHDFNKPQQARCRQGSRHNWFTLLAAFIVAVSLYDAWLVVHFEDYIPYMEENPFGQWLLRINGWRVGLLVRVKLAGTLIVLLALLELRRRWHRAALPVTAGVGSFQAGLLYYLTLY